MWQALKYGWIALASLGVLTGTTIYVYNNQRKNVKAEDVIEIALGAYERCLALQYQTNPVAWRVDPPQFVRTWYSNVYTTNGVMVYTNVVTNAIGWQIDRDMLISLDTTIKALVPYYVDTNTTAAGSTNMCALTVTGLWARLGIGNGTNRFTRTPCWTNAPGTTNATTNAATYGDYPWQIYAEDLVERYKVLNELKYTIASTISTNGGFMDTMDLSSNTWEMVNASWGGVTWTNWHVGFAGAYEDTMENAPPDPRDRVTVRKFRAIFGFQFVGDTNVDVIARIFGQVQRYSGADYFLSFEAPTNENEYAWFDNFVSPERDYVYWSTNVGNSTAIVTNMYMADEKLAGWKLAGQVLFDWQFQYCTNHYW